jgi:hypothetical protein
MSITLWNETNAFKNLKKKTTQLELYLSKKSPPDIITLITMANKVFGEDVMEPIIRELFQMSPKENTQHDGIRLKKKGEIKSARWHATGLDCNWQHLEAEYDYDFVIFVLVDFFGLKTWVITKEKLMGELRDKKIVLRQGQQGWTTNKKKIEPYLIPIQSVQELDDFIAKNFSESKTSPPQTDV